MSRLTQRKFKAICYYLTSWLVAAVGFSAVYLYSSPFRFESSNLLFVVQFAIFMGLSHGIYDVVILQDEMDHRPVVTALMIRSSFFLISISANLIICILLWSKEPDFSLVTSESIYKVVCAFESSLCQMSIFILFLLGHLITFIRSVHKKFGTRVFVNTLLGKYQDPKEEDLVFMFIDLKSSTTIAEQLGHVTYSNFIKDYYRLLSNCCEENQGEIYQFAGDGVFLTWKIKSCKHKAKPLNCFYDFKACLKAIAPKFIKRYGIAPDFKAAIHCGSVISTEVGNFGSEMAYHGDVLNTTSRIQALCGKLGQDFLISEDFFSIIPLPLPHNYTCTKEGFFELKGRKKGILIFSLHSP
ncbi:MAG: adenylate/guanylate cyclase domain-containing protein [Fibrobacteraceae bacterium]|nr:adenylate/guanylate cyclase domain-containing protein [Fibrobacteraceae bacterium]